MKRKLDTPSKLLIVSIITLVVSVVAIIIILLPAISLVGSGELSDSEIEGKIGSTITLLKITRILFDLAIAGVLGSLLLIIAKALRKKNGKAV